MFNNVVLNVRYWNDDAIMSNCNFDMFGNDCSFEATFKALLFGRTEEHFTHYVCNNTFGVNGDINFETVKNKLWGDLDIGSLHNIIIIGNIYGYADVRRPLAVLDDKETGFIKNYPEAKELTDIEKFLNNNNEIITRMYNIPENNVAVILVHNLDIRKYHVIQGFITRYFPNLFERNVVNGKTVVVLSENERLLQRSLTKTDYSEYLRLLNKIAIEKNVRILGLKNRILHFEKDSYQYELNDKNNQFENIMYQIHDLESRYSDCLRQKNEITISILGLEMRIGNCSENSELYDYLCAHKNIDVVKAEDNCLKIIIDNYIDSYDADAYETFSERGDIYNFDCGFEYEDRKLVMDNIFSADPKLRIKTCGYYELYLGNSVRTHSGYIYTGHEDRIPNPHLQYHACLGDNKPLIDSCLQKGDLIAAIEQCNGSAMAVNIHETSPTFKPFLRDLFANTGKILTNTDGTDMTIREAIKWLKGEN